MSESTILIVGATGLLGNAFVELFARSPGFRTVGAVRSLAGPARAFEHLDVTLMGGLDAESPDSLARVVAAAEPDVVVNCVGLIKQAGDAKDVMAAVPINTLLPHRLAALCAIAGARLVHVSTDCVFSGAKGNYREDDFCDADDVYGRSKLLGELHAAPAITLRTSIIGHELRAGASLLEWFLAQEGPVRGFTRAIFSGVPAVHLARIVRDHVLPDPALNGLYHVSAAPIAKFDLLQLIAERYGKGIAIEPDDSLRIDRSLDSSRFRAATGYAPPPWPELIDEMHRHRPRGK
ncbi:MAG: dTDP-4-dehydrorhamnose reductase family protein [Cypionkella sp.]